jgi:hypothetical protein
MSRSRVSGRTSEFPKGYDVPDGNLLVFKVLDPCRIQSLIEHTAEAGRTWAHDRRIHDVVTSKAVGAFQDKKVIDGEVGSETGTALRLPHLEEGACLQPTST